MLVLNVSTVILIKMSHKPSKRRTVGLEYTYYIASA